MRDPGVDAGHVAGTADTPGDEPHHGPPARLSLADQGAAPVPRAGILAHLAPGADLAITQCEPVAAVGPLPVEGRLQPGVAAVALDEGQVDLVLDELEATVHLVLAPASNPTPESGAVVEGMGELVLAGGQAGCVHVRLVKVVGVLSACHWQFSLVKDKPIQQSDLIIS